MDAIVSSSRRERKKEKTRLKIIGIAMELFRTQGFDSTTMEQIAGKADIAKGTLYNYFPVKEAIISEYWQDSVNEYKTRVSGLIRSLPDTRSRLLALFEDAVRWTKKNLDIAGIYMRFRMQNIGDCEKNRRLRSGFEGVLARILKAGQEGGDIRRDIAADVLARHLEFMYTLTFYALLAAPDSFPLKKSLARTIDLFLYGAGLKNKDQKGKKR